MKCLPRCCLVGLAMLALLSSAAAADGPGTAPATEPMGKPALAMTALGDVPTVAPGGKIVVTVTIKNATDTPQTIDVPSMWWAHSDNGLVTFPRWPARGGIGPAVIFRPVTIAPGKTYSHTWTATVSAEAPAGELSFRIGVPLKRGGGDVWSDEVKVTVQKP